MGRSVAEVVIAHRQLEGGGFPVRRPFPAAALSMLDPFLLLDEMGPVVWGPREAVGAPDHPHRGFETVTYVLQGEVHHEDSEGHASLLGPGDVQWMTAGAGVVHSERPSERLRREGGPMHGFQLWVNLPRERKWIAPRYQDLRREAIPAIQTSDGKATVRVIAGRALGATSSIETQVPLTFLHPTVCPGGAVTLPVDRAHTAFVYVFSGQGLVDAQPVQSGQMAVLRHDGDDVTLTTPASVAVPLEALLIAGPPLREPVARYGPFVMNTREELLDAFEDYRAGRIGRIRRTTDP